MKKWLMISLLILLSGCTSYNQTSDELTTINEYFNTTISEYSVKIVNSEYMCLNGTCPQPETETEYNIKDCWFCDNEFNGITSDNKFKVSMGVTGSSDSFAGCTQTWGKDETSGEYEIITMNDTHLITRVLITGEVEKTGDCTETYHYTYENTEEWIFSK